MTELRPTQTSYAVLGLLAVRPWTTYELVRQSERSLRWFFPRAERAVYLEAKRLVQLEWAEAEKTSTGRRPSTVYRITKAGRSALRGWLREPSTPTFVESEAALKVFFADQGGIDELRATIHGVREEAVDAMTRLASMAGNTLAAQAPFPERLDTNVLSMKLITDIHRTLRSWADWADTAVTVLEQADPDIVTHQTAQLLREIAEPPVTASAGVRFAKTSRRSVGR